MVNLSAADKAARKAIADSSQRTLAFSLGLAGSTQPQQRSTSAVVQAAAPAAANARNLRFRQNGKGWQGARWREGSATWTFLGARAARARNAFNRIRDRFNRIRTAPFLSNLVKF